MKCFDENTQMYQWLQQVAKASGISEFKLRASVGQYYDKYNTWPPLDYIPGIDSEKYLRQQFKIKATKNSNIATVQNILNFTGKKTLLEAQQFLNNTYVDQEITFVETVEGNCLVKFRKRPNLFSNPFTENINWTAELVNRGVMDAQGLTQESSTGILNNIISRITERYGVQMKNITSADIEHDPELSKIPNIKTAEAFIHNGTIYINTDYARADAPLHELMHLIIGQLRTSNPTLYINLLNSIEGDPDTEINKIYLRKLNELQASDVYKNRTRNDLNEEILVSEFARFITDPDYKGIFTNEKIDLIISNISRAIDSILLPTQSSSSVPFNLVMADSIVGLSQKLGSTLIIPTYTGTLNYDEVLVSQRLANYKQKLINDKKLEEICES